MQEAIKLKLKNRQANIFEKSGATLTQVDNVEYSF